MNAEYIETIAGKTPVEVSHVFLSDGRRCWVPGYLSLEEAKRLVARATVTDFWVPAAVRIEVFRGSRFGMAITEDGRGSLSWRVMILVLNRLGIAIDHQYAGDYTISGMSFFDTREDAMAIATVLAVGFDMPATIVVLDDGPTDSAGMADVRDACAALSSEGGE